MSGSKPASGVDFSAVRRLLANRQFAAFSGGKLLSDLGEWAQRVTLLWLAWELTGSAFWLGVVAFADLFPTVVIGLLAGTFIDRSDYARLVQIVQGAAVVLAVALTAVTAGGLMTIEVLTLLTLMRGAAHAFYRVARMVLVYNLVQGRDLAPAIAIGSIIFNGSRFLGPAIGGGLMVLGGPVLSFGFGAVCGAVFLVILAFLKLPPTPPRAQPSRGLWQDTVEGIRYGFTRAGLALLLVIVVITALAVRPFTDLLPAFADGVFGRGVGGLTLLVTASGLGATVAGIWLAGRPGGVRGLTGVVMTNLLTIGIAVLAFTLMPSIWLALPFVGIAGFALVVQAVAVQTLVQASVAPEMRGRVLGLYTLLARGGPAIGAVIMGAAAEWLGPAIPVGTGALMALALWGVMVKRRAAIAGAVEADEPEEAEESSRSERTPRDPG